MISKEKITTEEFIAKLKKSKHIIFYDDYDDVKIYINGYGNIFNIVKVKRGVVTTSIDGFKGSRKIEVGFLKYWLDEYKLKIE
jgi:predicted methyltransferase